MRHLFCIALVLMAQPSLSRDLPPLSEVSRIDDRMLWIAIAIEVSDRCPDIAPRRVRGLRILWDLRSEARGMGYTEAEIRDYAESDASEARARRLGEEHIRRSGFDPETVEGLCAFGHDQIDAQTFTGSLLNR